MRRAEIFRSGAFRFALLLALVFAVGSLLLLWTVESSISRYAQEAIAGSLQSEAAVLSIEDREGGRKALLTAIQRHRHSAREQQFRYLFQDAIGKILVNDLGRGSAGLGWGTVSIADDDVGADRQNGIEQLKSLGTRLGDGSLLVIATDAYDVQELRHRLNLFTIWSGVGISLFALVGGFLIGGLFMRRLDRVNESVSRIMEGNLTERLPTIGMSPEFDVLSANLNRMLDRIGSLMEGMRQVSTDIAHDLRTPLSRLRQHLEATRGSASIERYDIGVERAIAQADDILTIFRALLRIGSLEGGIGRQRFSIVDLSEIMNRVYLAYQPVAEDQGKSLVADHAPNTSVQGDGELLAQVFTNLIDNALGHTPPGTQIVSTLSLVNGQVVASISDDGPGIPASERSNVLGRFYRLDRSRHMPGSGLGLALVAAIASLHEIRLILEDNAPGLRVKLEFPLLRPFIVSAP
jgi:signal transduction histidine kinase